MPFTIGGEWVSPEKDEKKRKNSGRPVKVICEKRRQTQVTIILNLPLEQKELKALAKHLKKACACGGSIKGDTIEIQGDKQKVVREELKAFLSDKNGT